MTKTSGSSPRFTGIINARGSLKVHVNQFWRSLRGLPPASRTLTSGLPGVAQGHPIAPLNPATALAAAPLI
jgi:hypothetical protein